VIRGLHFQGCKPQAKIVSVVCGGVWDVIVDLRKESATYGKWEAITLNEENKTSLYVPRGFAHGFLALEESIVSYKCAEIFYGEYDDGIIWNDPDLAVAWPLERIGDVGSIILSDKDNRLRSFAEFETQMVF